ncbi:hypothetical protein CXB51_029935 [Gossypium anomalum]|uniref:Uncharacterized protein n=1 Tax=Gossypium anomalum TaxID=47600 RepID=A0A8J5Z0B9_9ROSI|nr:hypothetical protein CXB51_029935 [Gossypium anomalum]
MLVFPTPPIPQTPIFRTSSFIKHCQISSMHNFVASPDRVEVDKTCPIRRGLSTTKPSENLPC